MTLRTHAAQAMAHQSKPGVGVRGAPFGNGGASAGAATASHSMYTFVTHQQAGEARKRGSKRGSRDGEWTSGSMEGWTFQSMDGWVGGWMSGDRRTGAQLQRERVDAVRNAGRFVVEVDATVDRVPVATGHVGSLQVSAA